MRVLIITPSFPPYGGSHTQRMIALANSLSKAGVEVFVLTTEIIKSAPGYDEKLLSSISDKITVFRCKFGILHRNLYLKHKSLTDIKYGKNKGKTNKRSFKYFLVKFLEKTKGVFMIPDSLSDWKKPVLKYVNKERIIQRINPDLLISCSMPNTVHLICRKLSKKYSIPLLMDYADPWVYISYYNHSKLRFKFEKKMEEKCLRQASLYSFSTKGAEDLYIEKFGLDSRKTFTVVTGFGDDLPFGSGKISHNKSDPVSFTYGGALQPHIRFPKPFFEAVSEIDKNDISVLIRTDDINGLNNIIDSVGNNGNVFVQPYIPFNEYYEEMLKNDVLIFWGNVTTDQLPGKIFNYLPTKKIILYISNNDDRKTDQTVPILEDYSNFVYARNNKESIRKALIEIVGLVKGSKQVKEVQESQIVKYSTKNQFNLFYKKIVDFMGEKTI